MALWRVEATLKNQVSKYAVRSHCQTELCLLRMLSNTDEVLYIRLETPPPSPTSYIHVAEETPPQNQSRPSVVTPSRKRRREDKPRIVRPKQSQMSSPMANTMEDGPDWDMAAPELLTGSEPAWNSQDRVIDESELDSVSDDLATDRGYSEFCEAIQEEGGAFYQIGAELFVVNGWDARGKTSKVRLCHRRIRTLYFYSTRCLACLVPSSAINHRSSTYYCLSLPTGQAQ